MLKELLKNLGYADEDITKIEKGLSDSKIFLTKEENIETRYSKLKTEKEALETSSKNIQTEYENYKKGSISQEEYDKKVKEIQDKSAEDIKKSNLEHAIDMFLFNSNARNVKSVKANLDLSKVSLDGENLIGLKEQVENLVKTDSYLFNETKKINKGLDGQGTQKKDEDDDFDNDEDELSDEEYFAKMKK